MGNIHDGHRKRLKDRFLNEGLENFDEHQVLELLLFFSIPYKDTNKLAHKLLNKYGSLWNVFESDYNDLIKINGIGSNSASLISLIPQISRKYIKNKWGDKPLISSTSSAGEYVKTLFTGCKYEVFYLICLNNRNKVNFASVVHEGTINESIVYPRIIVELALRHQAANVIIAHNHPGGSLNPSSVDIELTKKIVKVLNLISIKVFDHIIVNGKDYFSFAENALISNQ
jgi:DNA repair protein RadC